MLKRAAKRGQKNILLCWNRGLGDIPLGVAAIVHRIFHHLPDATVYVLTRPNLQEGFSLLKGVTVFVDPTWKRGEPIDWKQSVAKLGLGVDQFDLVLDNPRPADWCSWQHKTFVPRLTWDPKNDALFESFYLSNEFFYLGVQVEAETNHGAWRNWPEKYWQEFFDLLAKLGNVRVLLFGFEKKQQFSHPMVIDLRGKTTLLELLSIIKNRCSALVLPDSGILSFFYFLDAMFPIRIISLWADPRQGILKQAVTSPNLQLVHKPLIGEDRDLSKVTPAAVLDVLFPKPFIAPLRFCPKSAEITQIPEEALQKAACIILAGGQGSRLGITGPKGLFPILNKSLFEHLLDKIPPSMPVAVMTSSLNHMDTVEYFHHKANFGKRVYFFQQEMVDLLDEHYAFIGMGPNGNGSLYPSIVQEGILDRFEAEGIDTCLVVSVDNPLANPADAVLLTFHRQMEAEVTIQCVERKRKESMGALAIAQNKISIVEYLSIEEDPFLFSYTGALALSTKFIRKSSSLKLPYHWVRKKLVVKGSEEWVWKRERFLFDAFLSAESIKALCYPREMCYAPVKELENRSEVERALQQV